MTVKIASFCYIYSNSKNLSFCKIILKHWKIYIQIQNITFNVLTPKRNTSQCNFFYPEINPKNNQEQMTISILKSSTNVEWIDLKVSWDPYEMAFTKTYLPFLPFIFSEEYQSVANDGYRLFLEILIRV